MESFCSLDELVADAKKHFLVLIKFGTLENLKSLQNGSLVRYTDTAIGIIVENPTEYAENNCNNRKNNPKFESLHLF